MPSLPSIRRWLRLASRVAALGAAVVLLAPLVRWRLGPLIVPAASPFVAAGSALAARSVTAVTLVAAPVLLAVLVWRRWFCRWACPVGLLTECAGKVSPVPKSWCDRLPPLGRWAAVLTLAGACAGYPVLLWMDPLAILAGAFGPWPRTWTLLAAAPMLGLPAVLLLSWLAPGAWCRRVCPLGATQDLLASPQRLWRRDGEKGTVPGMPLGRRSLLALGAAAASAGVGAWLGRKLQAAGPDQEPSAGPLRPPGAAPGTQFAGLCVRCGNCVRACPARIIHPDLGGHGVPGLLAPLVRFQNDYCRENCVRCMEVCPSGAIRRPAGKDKLGRKLDRPIGLAAVDMDLCWLAEDRECTICRQRCPFEAIEYVWSEATYTRAPVVHAERCPGCGACEIACPATNAWEQERLDPPPPERKAIRVVRRPREA